MGKVIISVVTFVLILTGSINAAPITINNVLTFYSTSASGSVNIAGDLNSYGWDSINFQKVSETYNYNLSFQNGSLCITLASLGRIIYIDIPTHSVGYEPAPVPEPASMLLLGLGIFSAGLMARKKIRKGD